MNIPTLLRVFKLQIVLALCFLGFSINTVTGDDSSCIYYSPVVTVSEGQLRGSVNNLPDGGTYFAYKGIPYAQAPLGELRFQAPLIPKPWIGVRDATKFGEICIQLDSENLISGSEDCLFLNVYTKSIKPKTKFPVMVLIPGGEFLRTSGNSDMYGPEFLVSDDVILVTLNYRLEVLGFLCLDIPGAPGNAGMKDQVAALRWIKRNIAKFGGDPDNITILGISAGSASVTYHLLSQMSVGLFHKAIAQSGVCLTYWTEGRNYVERAFRIGQVLGNNFQSKEELLTFLQNVPAMDLVGMTDKTKTEEESHVDLQVFFNPVVEKQFDNIEPFITEEPLDILIAGNANKVPIIIGYTSAEGILVLNDTNIQAKNDDVKYLVPRNIAEVTSAAKIEEFGQRIKQFYVGNGTFNNCNSRAFINLVTDTNFFFDAHRFATYHATKTKQVVYAYRFDYDTALNLNKIMTGYPLLKGACHTDDLNYLFRIPMNILLYKNHKTLRELIERMTKIWTNFVKTGNPTSINIPVCWEEFNLHQNYMNLREPLSISPNVDSNRLKFWKQLYCEAGVSCL